MAARHAFLVRALILSLGLVDGFFSLELWLRHNITRNYTLPTASLAKTGSDFGVPWKFLLRRGLLQHRLENDSAVICIRKYPVQSLFRKK